MREYWCTGICGTQRQDGSLAWNYDPSPFISSAEKFYDVGAEVGSREGLLEALHDR